jgi:uncharacterized protein YggE
MWAVQQSIKHPIGVTVYGSALLRTEPDVAIATIAISRVAKDPAESFKAARSAVQSVRNSLTGSGIELSAIEVSRVAVEDAFEGFGSTHKFVGYRARVTFRVRIHDVELVESVLASRCRRGGRKPDPGRQLPDDEAA